MFLLACFCLLCSAMTIFSQQQRLRLSFNLNIGLAVILNNLRYMLILERKFFCFSFSYPLLLFGACKVKKNCINWSRTQSKVSIEPPVFLKNLFKKYFKNTIDFTTLSDILLFAQQILGKFILCSGHNIYSSFSIFLLTKKPIGVIFLRAQTNKVL